MTTSRRWAGVGILAACLWNVGFMSFAVAARLAKGEEGWVPLAGAVACAGAALVMFHGVAKRLQEEERRSDTAIALAERLMIRVNEAEGANRGERS